MKLLRYSLLFWAFAIPVFVHTEDDFDEFGDIGDFEEPSVAVVQPPPLPTTGTPMPIDLPFFGTINLYPYTDEVTKQSGFRVQIPAAHKQIALGPLVVNNGALLLVNGKLMYGADATLFGVGARISLKDVSSAETIVKDGKKEESHTKFTWGIDPLPGQVPTLELIPGAKFVIKSADIVFEKKKPIILRLHTSIADKSIDFNLRIEKKRTDIAVAIPRMPLTQLIPEAQGTPVEQAQLSEISISVDYFISRENPPQKRIFTFTAQADFSGVPGLEGSDAKVMALIGKYDDYTKTTTIDATAKDINLPEVGIIHDAKIGVLLSKAKKSAMLQGKMDIDAGFGAFSVDVNAEITNKGIGFSAEIGHEISAGGVTVRNPKLQFSTITKQVSIAGEADILGRTTSVTLIRDKAGKFGLQTSLAGSVKPFSILNIPVISDFEIQDVKMGVQKQKQGSAVAFTGKVNFMGQLTGITWATTPDGKVAAAIDIPGTLDIVAFTKQFGPIGTMFDTISKIIAIKLNNAKLMVANGAVAILPEVAMIAPGFDFSGAVEVGGFVGEFLNMMGLRGGLTGDIFLPLNPSDVTAARVAISKTIDASLAGDFVKVSAFALNVQGAQPFPKVGIALQANVAGADVNLEGNFDPIGAIDLEGSIKGNINLNKIGFPIEIDHPSFGLHLLEGEPTGLMISGKFQVGNQAADIYADVDVKDPANSVIQFSHLNMCMTDMYNFWLTMAQKSLGAVGGPKGSISIPNLFCIEDAKGQWALKPVIKKNCTKDCVIIPGLVLEGKINPHIPGLPAGLGHFEFSPSQITMQGSLDNKIDLGGVISITDATGQKPPSMGMKISADEQRLWIDGVASIAGILKSQTQAELNTSGIQVKTVSSLLGVQSQMNGQFPFAHPEQGTLEYIISDEKLVNFIKDDLGRYLTIAKAQVSKYAQDADGALSSAQGSCGNIEVLSDLCKGPLEIAKGSMTVFKETVNAAMTAIDQIATNVTKQFHISSVSLKGGLAAFKGEGPMVTATFSFTVLGKDVGPVSISIPNPKDMGELAQKIAEYIYNSALSPLVNQLIGQVKALFDKITGFINDTLKAIAGAFQDIAKAAQAVVQVATQFGNDIKDTTMQVGNSLKTIGNQVGGDIKNVAVDAANKVANAATLAGGQIANTAVNMGTSAASFATETGDFTVESANKIKNAFESAGNEIAGGFKKVGSFFSSLF